DLETGLPQLFAECVNNIGRGMMQIPARFVGMQKLGRLPRDARKRSEDLFNFCQVPSIAEFVVEFGDGLLALGVVKLRAEPAENVVRPRQSLGPQQIEDVVHETPGVVTQERALAAGERFPGMLEATSGFWIAQQSAIQVR